MSGSTTESSAERFERDGVLVLPAFLSHAEADRLAASLPNNVAGFRNTLRIPDVGTLANDARIASLLRQLRPEPLCPVRGLFFDKNPAANWAVAWHQDVAVALRERIDVTHFGPWSTKAGVVHAHAPALLLARMVTLRLHLDDCGPENGPLKVIPGSHSKGRLDDASLIYWPTKNGTECLVEKGGLVLISPLLLHASSPARKPTHRPGGTSGIRTTHVTWRLAVGVLD